MDTQRSFNNSKFGDYSISDVDLAKVAENRSLYGNYVDNSLAYDQFKEKKSVYDVVFSSDIYDPWGKPGGGAPMMNRQNGRIDTKIKGRLQWNLDGTTDSAKTRNRQALATKIQPNLIEYRKTPSPVMKKTLNFEATTYRQGFGGIDNNNNIQQIASRTPRNDSNPLGLVREADSRNLNRYLKSNETSRANPDFQNNVTTRSQYQDFNSNSYQNAPSQAQVPRSYDYRHWFGNINGGGGAPTNDARRRKLTDMLENRHIYDAYDQQRRANSDVIYSKSDVRSSHKNNFQLEQHQK